MRQTLTLMEDEWQAYNTNLAKTEPSFLNCQQFELGEWYKKVSQSGGRKKIIERKQGYLH
jgi:hypothetical protein